jgi:hypothetical protein
MTETIANREDWLMKAAQHMGAWIVAVGEEPPPMRVSVGWPGGRAPKATTVGQCWPTSSTEDGVAQIFMTPTRGEDSTVDVLGTLLHEMVHAVDDCQDGHAKNFIRIARALGFVAKWTSSSNRTEELTAKLTELAEVLGTFPNAAIIPGSRSSALKKQGTRMIKLECPDDGYVVRTTRKWLDIGTPTCPCGLALEEEVK